MHSRYYLHLSMMELSVKKNAECTRFAEITIALTDSKLPKCKCELCITTCILNLSLL